ncbi:MAG: DUF2148 domain-containing protein [Candidatus Omnitrophica bacterium]|nr:DUF2148 domain-containing protein [Candidatus Omnitrophota bacterium]
MIDEKKFINEILKDAAKKMVLAARTAPKGRGIDTFTFCLAEDDDIKKISKKMKEIGEESGAQAFLRDSQSILSSPVIVLLGTAIKAVGLKRCSRCGFKDCDEKEKHKNIPCAFNTGDLGIAIGSAVSVAADNRVDCRVMHTVGAAALELGLLGKDVKIAFGVPLSATSKNPFFDRK